MKKIGITSIILLILIDIFFIIGNVDKNNRIEKLEEEIKQKQIQIVENNSQIELLSTTKEKAMKDSELIDKEYKVWVHQNEKLQDILN